MNTDNPNEKLSENYSDLLDSTKNTIVNFFSESYNELINSEGVIKKIGSILHNGTNSVVSIYMNASNVIKVKYFNEISENQENTDELEEIIPDEVSIDK